MNLIERTAVCLGKALNVIAALLPDVGPDPLDYDAAVDALDDHPVFNEASEPMAVTYRRWLPGDPEPTHALGPGERYRRWVSSVGTHWKWESGRWWHNEVGSPKIWIATPYGYTPNSSGPFTELVAQPMSWLDWATPAILEALAEHESSGCRCACEESLWGADTWREHVAPLIAERIACDPQRAIEALTAYNPKVTT